MGFSLLNNKTRTATVIILMEDLLYVRRCAVLFMLPISFGLGYNTKR